MAFIRVDSKSGLAEALKNLFKGGGVFFECLVHNDNVI